MIRSLIVGVLACGWTLWLGDASLTLAQEPPEPTEQTAPAEEPKPEPAASPAEGQPPEPVEEPADAGSPDEKETSTDSPIIEEGTPPEPEEEAESSTVESTTQVPKKTDPPAEAPTDAPPAEKTPTETEEKAEDKANGELSAKELAEMRRVGPKEALEMVGITGSQIWHLRDGWPLSDEEQEVTLKLMYRVRRFGMQEISQWTDPNPPLEDMAQNPDKYRLQMFQLRGRVEQVIVEEPPKEVMERYDMQKYYACQVTLEGSKQPVLIVTPTIPSQWNLELPLDEPVSAQGLFLKSAEKRGEHSQLVFIAGRLAWHPDTVREHLDKRTVSLGMTELGNLGMDVSLFDEVQNQSPITRKDREAFYQALDAVNRAPQNQLARIARSNLQDMQKIWLVEARQSETKVEEMQKELQSAKLSETENQKLTAQIKKAKSRAAVLKKAAKEAEEGRYSVFPLFNLAAEQHGRLVLLEGVARRVVKVEVANPRDPESNRDIIDRFGIDHYYEIAIFTKDSRDNPIIVCARELPKGFPTGEVVNEPVIIAGFFFKTWAFYTTAESTAEGQLPPNPKRKLAPLLITRAPIWNRPPEEPKNSNVAYTIGGVFMALTLLAVISVWRFNKRAEEFRKDVIVRKYDVDSGISLNDVGLTTVDGPDFSHLHDGANTDTEQSTEEVSSSSNFPDLDSEEKPKE